MEIPGKPGAYNAVAHLRPWLQFEELTTSLRMVARIPQMGG
jgi:type VI secretion system protein ImpC